MAQCWVVFWGRARGQQGVTENGEMKRCDLHQRSFFFLLSMIKKKKGVSRHKVTKCSVRGLEIIKFSGVEQFFFISSQKGLLVWRFCSLFLNYFPADSCLILSFWVRPITMSTKMFLIALKCTHFMVPGLVMYHECETLQWRPVIALQWTFSSQECYCCLQQVFHIDVFNKMKEKKKTAKSHVYLHSEH